MTYDNMMGYGLGFGGTLLMLLFWIAIILVIFWLIKQLTNQGNSAEILDKRYAKGEITKKEYQEMKKELKK